METNPGVVLGTFSYMSPEQARGAAIDGRSDVFSLGIMLYEMIAGRLPFGGATPADVLGAILYVEPAPIGSVSSVPDTLARVVGQAISKRPDSALPDDGQPGGGSEGRPTGVRARLDRRPESLAFGFGG